MLHKVLQLRFALFFNGFEGFGKSVRGAASGGMRAKEGRKIGEILTTFRGSGPWGGDIFARIKLKLKEEQGS